ncbi:unnamed protein product [Protopolystoma xenopodis]|uniref:Uncharacterized protein n=1 Tax=Protopolystoma xenopodis TaxID=117903 RepID=A0A3S5AVZ1_9PLAT|nr:unnamed protein product [Protopolystoma xenopodis]
MSHVVQATSISTPSSHFCSRLFYYTCRHNQPCNSDSSATVVVSSPSIGPQTGCHPTRQCRSDGFNAHPFLTLRDDPTLTGWQKMQSRWTVRGPRTDDSSEQLSHAAGGVLGRRAWAKRVLIVPESSGVLQTLRHRFSSPAPVCCCTTGERYGQHEQPSSPAPSSPGRLKTSRLDRPGGKATNRISREVKPRLRPNRGPRRPVWHAKRRLDLRAEGVLTSSELKSSARPSALQVARQPVVVSLAGVGYQAVAARIEQTFAQGGGASEDRDGERGQEESFGRRGRPREGPCLRRGVQRAEPKWRVLRRPAGAGRRGLSAEGQAKGGHSSSHEAEADRTGDWTRQTRQTRSPQQVKPEPAMLPHSARVHPPASPIGFSPSLRLPALALARAQVSPSCPPACLSACHINSGSSSSSSTRAG